MCQLRCWLRETEFSGELWWKFHASRRAARQEHTVWRQVALLPYVNACLARERQLNLILDFRSHRRSTTFGRGLYASRLEEALTSQSRMNKTLWSEKFLQLNTEIKRACIQWLLDIALMLSKQTIWRVKPVRRHKLIAKRFGAVKY